MQENEDAMPIEQSQIEQSWTADIYKPKHLGQQGHNARRTEPK